MNITLDDSSPRIQYYSVSSDSARSWGRGKQSLDAGTANYFRSTFTVTKGEGDRMELAFNGTSIWIYGSKWFNHGWFSVRIDDRDPVLKIDTAPAQRVFQTVLHAEEDLDASKEHTITLTNLAGDARKQAGDYYLDIDYIVIQQPITSKIYTTVLDDASPRIRYSGAWSANTAPDGSTGHVATRPGDTGTLSFNGSSVEVLGTIYPDHGLYTVSIDGMPKGTFDGYAETPVSNASLFSASGLNEGEHNMVITNIGGPKGNFFDINTIIFNSTVDPSLIAYPTPLTPSRPKEPTSVAGIAGGVAGGLVALIIIGAIAWLIWRRKRREESDEPKRVDLTGEEVKPFQAGSPDDERLDGVRSDYFLPAASTTRFSASEWDRQADPAHNLPRIQHSPVLISTASSGYHPAQLQSAQAPSTLSTGTSTTSFPSQVATTLVPRSSILADTKSAAFSPTAVARQSSVQAEEGRGQGTGGTTGSSNGHRGDGGALDGDGHGDERAVAEVLPPPSYDLAVGRHEQ